MQELSFTERMWQQGQEHLGALRYGAAVRCLEAAEISAWQRRDGEELARIYLPLLEARRQIRYQAAEGTIVICGPDMSPLEEHTRVREFIEDPGLGAGTLLLGCKVGGHGQKMVNRQNVARAQKFAGAVKHAARRTGRFLEMLLLLGHGDEVRLASPADATLAGGLQVIWSRDLSVTVGDSVDANLRLPLPGGGRFESGHPLHAMIRESLLIGWEALALTWQHRHPPLRGGGMWEEMAWLRLALRIDPACEPVAMRMMTLGQAAERSGAV